MRRFWIDRSCLKDQEFLIKNQLYHHICRVCQIKKGEAFELYCEGTQKYKVCLNKVSSSRAVAKILETHPVPPLKKPHIHLALSIPRLPIMDSLIEKSVELGVKEFHPFISHFSFFKKVSKISPERQKRWQKIADQNLAQSGRTEPLILHPPCLLDDIQIPSEDLAFLAYEGTSSLPFLSDKTKKPKKASSLWLFIGSEGGFSSEEAENFSTKKNGQVFSMGLQILKVETACLFGLSLLKYHYHF